MIRAQSEKLTVKASAPGLPALHRVAFVNAPLGALGFVLLLLLKNKLDGDVMREGGGLIAINYEFAFWVVAGIFLAISLLNGFSIFAPRISEPAR